MDKNLLKKLGITFSSITGAMSIHSYVMAIRDNKLKEALISELERNKELQQKLENLTNDKAATYENINKVLNEIKESTKFLDNTFNILLKNNSSSSSILGSTSNSNPNSPLMQAIEENKADFSTILDGKQQIAKMTEALEHYFNNASRSNFNSNNN
jgi:hypothetical protein